MKKLVLAVSLIASLVLTSKAQVTNIPTFFNSAEEYLTSFNTNYDWSSVTIEAASSWKQVTSQGATDVINAEYHIDSRFLLGGSIQFEGVGSTIGSAQLITGYAFIQHFDTQASIEVESGYSWYRNTYVIEPELKLEKKLTKNTFALIGVSIPLFTEGKNSRTPCFETGLGFTY
ncbi:MAG: hypothetical protein ABSB40_13345 [Nitrososphaeria archaeon]|jgi:hypothetical protein